MIYCLQSVHEYLRYHTVPFSKALKKVFFFIFIEFHQRSYNQIFNINLFFFFCDILRDLALVCKPTMQFYKGFHVDAPSVPLVKNLYRQEEL